MEIELAEIRDFLAQRAPFDALPEDILNQLPESLSIRYQRRDTPFPPEDADDDYIYVVRSGAIEQHTGKAFQLAAVTACQQLVAIETVRA